MVLKTNIKTKKQLQEIDLHKYKAHFMGLIIGQELFWIKLYLVEIIRV